MTQSIGAVKLHIDGLNSDTSERLNGLISDEARRVICPIKIAYTYSEGECVLDLGDDEWRSARHVGPGELYQLIGRLVWNGFAVEVKTEQSHEES